MISGTSGPPESDFDFGWTDEDPAWVPPEIDTTRPSPARMYDYALGGKDNFEVDRRAVEQVAQMLPDFRKTAQDNRRFLESAVLRMAEDGIDQFVDIGTGIPTSPNVHEVARRLKPDARVVYVDNDPLVMAHNRALRAVEQGVITAQHDARTPDELLADPRVRELIDFSRPIGLLFVAVLHFVEPSLTSGIMARFRQEMAPGSYVAISTVSSEGMDPGVIAHIKGVFERSAAQVHFRTEEQIRRLFDGFDLLEPGIRDISGWSTSGTPNSVQVSGGIGRLP